MNKIRPTFDDAIRRLNSKNLEGLLEVSSLLSSLELFGSEKSEVFPMLNFEKCRLFVEAIVSSKAASYKSAMFSDRDLSYVMNAANAALDDRRLDEIVSGRPRDEMLYDLNKFFSRRANIQFRQQELPAIGRILGLLEVIPRKNINLFPEKYRTTVSQFSQEDMPRALSTSLRNLAVIYLFIADWYKKVNDITWKEYRSRSYINNFEIQPHTNRQAKILYGLYACLPKVRGYLYFSLKSLMDNVPPGISETSFDAFMDIFARTMSEIRDEGKKPVYQHGVPGWQLSPLEQYPVVAIKSGTQGTIGTKFIVPNVRIFLRSFADVIHFSLQERCGNSYNEVRGLSQEVYLRLLIANRLPYCIVIPETAYKTSSGEKRGPDLTIVDRKSSRLIVIESKARRVRAENRFTLDEKIFDQNFSESLYDPLIRLQEKISYLYKGIPEYQDYQVYLNSTKGHNPIYVVIFGESLYLSSNLIRYRAKKENNHPLRDFDEVHCIMSLDIFELAVEIAAAENITISQVLEEFWIDSGKMELDCNMAESFRDRNLPEGQTFAESFIIAED